jgi:hypothetical protein
VVGLSEVDSAVPAMTSSSVTTAVPWAGTACWVGVSGVLVMNFLSLLCPSQDIEHLQDDTEKYRYKKQHSGNPTENSGPSAAATAETSHHRDLRLHEIAAREIGRAIFQRVGVANGVVFLGECRHGRTIAHNRHIGAIL